MAIAVEIRRRGHDLAKAGEKARALPVVQLLAAGGREDMGPAARRIVRSVPRRGADREVRMPVTVEMCRRNTTRSTGDV